MATLSEIATPVKRLSLPRLIFTSTYALGVNLVWLAYNIFILPLQVQAVTSERRKALPRGAGRCGDRGRSDRQYYRGH